MDHLLHGKMDHGMPNHGMPNHDMPNHDMPNHDMPHHGSGTCKTSMLFTWEYENTCVVFLWWQITTLTLLLLSMIAIATLSAGYEYVKHRHRELLRSLRLIRTLPSNSGYSDKVPKTVQIKNALFYGALVGYSFMLMLVFMSFNGWLMVSVVAGATLGHYIWDSSAIDGSSNASVDSLEGETLACH